MYSYFFETPYRQKNHILKTGDTVPHPFILEPPFPHQKILEPGTIFSFNLILIGKGISYLPHLAYAVSEMATRGMGKSQITFELVSIELDTDGTTSTIYENNKLKEHPIVYRSQSFFKDYDQINQIEIQFLTPVRIKHEGHLCTKLNFELFIKNIIRRLSLLSLMHDSEPENINISDILKKSKSINAIKNTTYWYDVTRYSSRQNTSMQLGGLLGEIKFEGQLREFMPYIRLGSLLHVGKNTSFGLGRYKLLE